MSVVAIFDINHAWAWRQK